MKIPLQPRLARMLTQNLHNYYLKYRNDDSAEVRRAALSAKTVCLIRNDRSLNGVSYENEKQREHIARLEKELEIANQKLRSIANER